jgi:hypothetical protein
VGLSLSPADSFHHEYSALSVTVEEVNSLEEAIEHINRWGSGHTDCIVTEDEGNGEKFLNQGIKNPSLLLLLPSPYSPFLLLAPAFSFFFHSSLYSSCH